MEKAAEGGRVVAQCTMHKHNYPFKKVDTQQSKTNRREKGNIKLFVRVFICD
jgi:hypothetical protein